METVYSFGYIRGSATPVLAEISVHSVCLSSRPPWGCNRSGIVRSWGMTVFTFLDTREQFSPSLYVSLAEAESSHSWRLIFPAI